MVKSRSHMKGTGEQRRSTTTVDEASVAPAEQLPEEERVSEVLLAPDLDGKCVTPVVNDVRKSEVDDLCHSATGKPVKTARDNVIRGYDLDFLLWKAARLGNESDIVAALAKGANIHAVLTADAVTWLEEEDLDLVVSYKGRSFNCQALHAAAISRDETDSGSRKREQLKERVIEILLQARADPDATANSIVDLKSGGQQERVIEAIHFAAGAGNLGAMRSLIRWKADPNKVALIDGTAHYYPIHDAAWYNRADCLQWLLGSMAHIDTQNNMGSTAMHMAAFLGHRNLVERFIEHDREQSVRTMGVLDQNGKRPLDLAVERGRFPPQELYLFTLGNSPRERIHAFLTVAEKCPVAASALLRRCAADLPAADERPALQKDEKLQRQRWRRRRPSRDIDDEEGRRRLSIGGNEAKLFALGREQMGSNNISTEWRKSLQRGAEDGIITVPIFAKLLREAPMAAADLLDAVTEVPMVVSPEHHPLPVRSIIPHSHDPCQLSCAYEDVCVWTWSPKETRFGGGERWHSDFASMDPKYGREVKIQVVKLPGIADIQVLLGLSATEDLGLFTNMAVHALLKFIWSRLWIIFSIELTHEVLVILVINYWIADTWIPELVPTSYTIRCLLWLCVASQGFLECMTLSVVTWNCWHADQDAAEQPRLALTSPTSWWAFVQSNRLRTLRECLSRCWFRMVLACITVAIAARGQADFWPDAGMGSGTLLALGSLLHWSHILYSLRAFPWTGQRLLPIMKSVEPIAGMLVIMFGLFCGFLNAFFAINRSANNGASSQPNDIILVWNLLNYLLSGEVYMEEEYLRDLSDFQRVLTILCGSAATFLFVCCALNVFIAVLGDCYDQELERMICTLMKERAKVCSDLFLRPSMGPACSREGGEGEVRSINKTQPFLWLSGLTMVACIIVLVFEGKAPPASWISSITFSLCLFGLKALLRGRITTNWKTNFLWVCQDASITSDMFLTPDQSSPIASVGRISQLKKYMLEQKRDLAAQSQLLSEKFSSCEHVEERLQRMEDMLQDAYDDQRLTIERIEERQEILFDTCSQICRALERQGSEKSPPRRKNNNSSSKLPSREEGQALGHLEI